MWKTQVTLAAAALAGLGVPAMHNWTADLTPMPGHRVSGTATFNGDTKDVVKVSLTLENAPPNATLKWHVNKGACTETSAPIVGKESAYSPVQVDGSGRVNTTLNLPLNLNESGYSVRVREDGNAPSGKDYYQRQDSTMSRDTTMHHDRMYPKDTTKSSQWPSRATGDKGMTTAACGDLKPQTGEKANRQ